MKRISNTAYDALEIGMEAQSDRVCKADDFYVFANSSGNFNPMHLPKSDGDGDGKPEAIAPAMWVASLISATLGNVLPGPGTLYRAQTLNWVDHAHPGERLIAKVKLLEKGPDYQVTFKTRVERDDGQLICEGIAEVIAPKHTQEVEVEEVPGLTLKRHVHFDRLIEEAEPYDPIPTAIVAPEQAEALAGALLGAKHTLINPILIGDAVKIKAAAEEIKADISPYEVIDIPLHSDAAARAVALVHEGKAAAVMKGHLHTDELLRHIVKRDGGLRTGRRLSHVFVMDVPGLDRLLMVTDAAINITPDLQTKADIVQNAIDLALALGVHQPKAGVLCAVETVNPQMPSTLDAAALSKMSERGQITGGIVDGPLAMDNAISLEAAKTKGIRSLVAGYTDILVAPNIEAGNMLAKELTFVAQAEAAGIVMGAQVPIILTSRSDDDKARLASCAVAALYANRSKI